MVDTSFGFIVYRTRGSQTEFLLLRRRDNAVWDFPKGHAVLGEGALSAARRELQEETGLTIIDHIGGFRTTTTFMRPNGELRRFTLFLARARHPVHLSAEHSAARWCTIESAFKLVPFPERQRALRRAVLRIAAHPRRLAA